MIKKGTEMIKMFCIFFFLFFCGEGGGEGGGVSSVFPPSGKQQNAGKKKRQKKNGEKKPRKGKIKKKDLTRKGQSALRALSGDSGRDLRRKPPDLGNAEK